MDKTLIIGGCGYIGSRLYLYLKERSVAVDTLDLERRGNHVNPSNYKLDFSNVSQGFLESYDNVVFLAGHSSVAACAIDPRGALEGGILKFFDLITRLRQGQTLIYASSSSVYSGSGATSVDELWQNYSASNVYDLTKYAADALVSIYCKTRYYGLRFGTVCGPSPNMRPELVLNAMTHSALTRSRVMIQNPKVHRPILGMNDLCRAVFETLRQRNESGVYNLASFVTTIGGMGHEVARLLDADVELRPDTPSYDFSMSSNKFERLFQFQFKDTIASLVHGLVSSHKPLTRKLVCNELPAPH